MLEELDGVTTDAIEFAVERGWVVVQAGHSICLTDAGRRQRAASLMDRLPGWFIDRPVRFVSSWRA
jgi:hypothetical protein